MTWLNGWLKRRSFDISPSVAIAGYQYAITIPYYSDMQADFSDIRFTDSDGNYCPYWIEAKADSSAASVWVKTPKASTSQIYMYYENPTAVSESNGENVFELFDDFKGNSVNTTKWTCAGNMTYSLSNSVITIDGSNYANGRMYCNNSYGVDYAWRSRSKWSGNGGSCFFGFHSWSQAGNAASIWDTSGYEGYVGNGTGINSNTTADSSWHNIDIIRNSNTSVIFKKDGSAYWSPTTNIPTISLTPSCRQYPIGYSQQHEFILIRKYSSTNPVISPPGSEVSAPIQANRQINRLVQPKHQQLRMQREGHIYEL